MKRFFGGVFALLGAGVVIWAAYHILAGQSEARLTLTPDLAVNGLTGGLLGVAMLTLGLLWVRD